MAVGNDNQTDWYKDGSHNEDDEEEKNEQEHPKWHTTASSLWLLLLLVAIQCVIEVRGEASTQGRLQTS